MSSRDAAIIALATLVAFVVPILLMYGQTGSSKADVDLGIARFPATDRETRGTFHRWRKSRFGQRFVVGYAHGVDARSALRRDHADLGKRLGFSWVDDESFRWTPPPTCFLEPWECIYSDVHARSFTDLEPLLDRIRTGFDAESWTPREAAQWLLNFVQQIPYRLPTEEAFGLLPPALVASEDWGDCDSKSLLLISLLERLGINAILLTSKAHAHALVGIAVPTGQKGHRHEGREYAWAETTAENAPLGWLHPQLHVPNDWRVALIR